MTPIDKRIPSLTDIELQNLHGNAIRAAQSGTPAQQVEAERLLPIIGAEVEVRAKARAAEQAARREAAAAARKARKTAV
jgi:hypothetical protein